MNKQIFFSLAFLLCLNLSFAQYGWTNAEVYLKKGQVLKGEAKIPMMGAGMNLSKETLKYRLDKKNEVSVYKPEEVDSVIFELSFTKKVKDKTIKETQLKTFRPVFLNKKETRLGFVQVLIDGELKLVGRNILINFGGNSPNIVIDVNNDKKNEEDYMGSFNQIMLLKKSENPLVFYRDTAYGFFERKTSQYLEDCPELVEKIKSEEFKKEDVSQIVEYYNTNCD